MPDYKKLLDSIAKKDSVKDKETPQIVQRFFLPGIDSWCPGEVTTEWIVDEMLLGPTGLFGGYIAMVSDTMAAHATYSMMNDNEWMATKSIKVDFKRPIRDGKIIAYAKATRVGDSISIEVQYSRSDGEIAYIAIVEQLVRSTKNSGVDRHQWNLSG